MAKVTFTDDGVKIVMADGKGAQFAAIAEDFAGNAENSAERAEEAADLAALQAASIYIPPPRLAIEGDSIMAQNHRYVAYYGPGDADFGETSSTGELVWARAQFPYFEMDQWEDLTDSAHYSSGCNFAVGGSTSEDALARADALTSVAPDIICLCTGINDINGGDTAVATMAVIEETVAYYRGLGKQVLLGNLRPVSASYAVGGVDWSNGSSRMVQRDALNALIADFAASTQGVHLVDLAAAYSNGASPPRPAAADVDDGLHPSRTGAFKGGQAWLAALKKLIKPITPVRATGTHLISNNELTGTSGTASTGVTGSVATSWSIVRVGAGNGTAFASKDADDNQVLTISPGSSGGYDMFQISRENGGAAFVAGKSYKGRFRVKLAASDYWRGVTMQGSELKMVAMGTSAEAFTASIPYDQDLTLEVETPVFVCEANETGSVFFRVAVDTASPSDLVATIYEIAVQEVPDPRPLHGFAIA